jgi:hypothetical protein
MYPLTPIITLEYRENLDSGIMVAVAWAVGSDCRRSTHEWAVESWMVTAYPALWDEGLRRLAAAVQRELEQAGTWMPPMETMFEERADHAPHRGLPPAPAATAG